MGPSGSGKSTLLHCLAGLDRVDHGEVQLGGVDLSSLDERRLTRLRRDRVGFVFQSLNLLPTLTAAENITLPLAIAGRRPDRAWLDRVVDAVGLRDRLRLLHDVQAAGLTAMQLRDRLARAAETYRRCGSTTGTATPSC